MNRSTIDLWVGIFVVIGIGALAFLSLKVGNLTSVSSAPGYHLEAAFDNIGGLKLRAPVKAAGVVVGRVERINLDPQSYQALVTMRTLADSEGVRSIAMPRIGVGYGGLSWRRVREIVERVFAGWAGALFVYEEYVPQMAVTQSE